MINPEYKVFPEFDLKEKVLEDFDGNKTYHIKLWCLIRVKDERSGNYYHTPCTSSAKSVPEDQEQIRATTIQNFVRMCYVSINLMKPLTEPPPDNYFNIDEDYPMETEPERLERCGYYWGRPTPTNTEEYTLD